jgi:peptidyl-prolyl cis-trans isomerase D
MAFLAIFAMIAFTLDFSLFRSNFGPSPEDRVVVELYGSNVRQHQLNEMMAQRSRANRFMLQAGLTNRPDFFGPVNDTRSIVDALILQHEADELKMPAGQETAVAWLREQSRGQLTTAQFDRVYRQEFADEVTDGQLLEDLANQLRLMRVASLPGFPPVTPLDVFDAYRDQEERVGANLVAFRVDDFVKDVPDPLPESVQAYYEKYKDQLPDRLRETPGFKVPRRIQAEFVSKDAEALAREIQDRLTDEELKPIFAARPDDFPVPPPELPLNLFAGDPDAKLTPRLTDPFDQVKDFVARTVARERANEEIDRLFNQVREEVMAPFAEKYGEALDAAREAEEGGRTKTKSLPEPGDALKTAAERLGLAYEKTPLLDRELAEKYGQIGNARRGAGPFGGGTSFADEMFTRNLYEDAELSDPIGRRFLTWKLADVPARVPPFNEVRPEVIYALKREKARELAQKAAEDLAKTAREAGGDLAKAATDRPVIVTTPVPELQPGAMINPFQPQPSQPSEILQVPDAGAEFRKAYFDLEPGAVAVAPNAPKTVYYVMTLNQRSPAPFEGLYASFGPRAGLQNEVMTDAIVRRGQEWLEELRARAGLSPDWVPPDEQERAEREPT